MERRDRQRQSFAVAGAEFVGDPATDQRTWLKVAGPYGYQTLQWNCTDFVKKTKREDGTTPPSDLYIKKTDFHPCFLSTRRHSNIDGKLEYMMSQAPCNVPGTFDDLPPGGWSRLEGTTEELTAKLLADTNPFRYEVSVPIMIAELLEAASLLKLAANNFVSLIGSAHLNEVFGWKPMIQDIKTLAGITGLIESRVKEFNSLLKQGGLRRRKHLANGSDSREEARTSVYSNGRGEWSVMPTTTWRTKVWGTVRWAPNRASPIDVATLANFNEALKIVLDLRVPDASTIWEAIPFSWLVDYVLNVGDTLQALEDTDKVLPYDICIMREREVTTSGTIPAFSDADWRTVYQDFPSSGYVKHTYKLRSVVQPTGAGDLLSFGILSKGQATNLLALVMSLTRFKK